MAQSLRVARSVRRFTTGLLWLAVLFILASTLIGILLPSHPWPSVLVGLALALAMFGVSLATTRMAAKSETLSVGPIALDYVVKIVLVAVGLVAAKNLDILNVKLVAGIVALAVLSGMLVQVWAFMVPGRKSDDDMRFD